jgi:hypothetical protein
VAGSQISETLNTPSSPKPPTFADPNTARTRPFAGMLHLNCCLVEEVETDAT